MKPIRLLGPARAALAALPLAALPLLGAPCAGAADLAEVYQRALRNDPQLREADANRLAALEARPQALASLLPQLGATAGYTNDDVSGASLAVANAGVLVPYQSAARTDATQWSLQLRQTLFRWDQIAALRRAGVQVTQAEVDFRAAQQDVIVRTATAYFNVLAARDTLDAAEAARDAIGRQLEQTEKRYEVGLIAVTDVEEARAASDQAVATVIADKRALATTREQLRELTGDAFDELKRPGEDMPLIAPEPAAEEQWVRAALDQNLQLSSARLGVDIARENIAVARSGHLPALDIVASRSATNTNGTYSAAGLVQPADTSNYDRQIGVQLTFPIYAGGGTASRVRQAVFQQRAARERLERTARATERQTRDSYLGVLSEISRVRALKQAVASSDTALKATEAGYEVGTRTTVDVLLARQRLLDAQTTYARSRYDYIINVLLLEQAGGTLDETRLTRVNGWLGQTVTVK